MRFLPPPVRNERNLAMNFNLLLIIVVLPNYHSVNFDKEDNIILKNVSEIKNLINKIF